jgi:hypothetical protein
MVLAPIVALGAACDTHGGRGFALGIGTVGSSSRRAGVRRPGSSSTTISSRAPGGSSSSGRRLPGERAPRLEHDAESEQRHADRLEAEPSGGGLADELRQFAMDCVDTCDMLLVGLAARSLLVVDSAVEVAQLLLVILDRASETLDPLLESLRVPRGRSRPLLELGG